MVVEELAQTRDEEALVDRDASLGEELFDGAHDPSLRTVYEICAEMCAIGGRHGPVDTRRARQARKRTKAPPGEPGEAFVRS